MKAMKANDVYQLLGKRFPEGPFCVIPQVRNTTGSARKIRTADAIVVSTWPSRGLWIGGVEIKVRLSDWRKEFETPDKAEPIQRYCHFWWVAAPKGLIPAGEVPTTWGLLECTPKQIRQEIDPECMEPAPIDHGFLASILRSVSGQAAGMVQQAIREKAEELAKQKGVWELRRLETELDRLRGRIKTFEDRSGLQIDNWDVGNIADAVAFVKESGVLHAKAKARVLRRAAAEIIEKIDATGLLEELKDD